MSTNAIVEGNTSDVTLMTQRGPGINYTFDELNEETYFLSGYVDHRGKDVHPLDQSELQEIKKQVEKKEDNLAVVTKFSLRNTVHEKDIVYYFKGSINNVTRGSKL